MWYVVLWVKNTDSQALFVISDKEGSYITAETSTRYLCLLWLCTKNFIVYCYPIFKLVFCSRKCLILGLPVLSMGNNKI